MDGPGQENVRCQRPSRKRVMGKFPNLPGDSAASVLDARWDFNNKCAILGITMCKTHDLNHPSLVVVAILAVALGYHLGLRVALNGVPHAAASVPPTTPKSAKKTRFAGMSESGSGSEDEESSAGLSSIKAGPSEECKLVYLN